MPAVVDLVVADDVTGQLKVKNIDIWDIQYIRSTLRRLLNMLEWLDFG